MKKLYFLAIVFSGLLIGCKKEKNLQLQPVNQLPIAIAGNDMVIDLHIDSVLLDGSSSTDKDGIVVNWQWTQISGPQQARVMDARVAKTQAYFDSPGTYWFELTVRDNDGLSAKDSMRVTVNPAEGTGSGKGAEGNLVFYFPDPTSSMAKEKVVTISFDPALTLVVVKIDKYSDGRIEGMWCNACEPRCPASNDYYAEPDNHVKYNLPPGTYTWTAETVFQTFNGYPFGNGDRFPGSLVDFFAKPHKTSGTVTIQPNETCLVQKIVF